MNPISKTTSNVYTTNCLNGELCPGGLVFAVSDDEYGCMVGRVLEVRKTGTPEHDTENQEDDVVVDFSVYTYSDALKRTIENAFSEAYNEPKCFEELALNLVIMPPSALVCIGHERPSTIERICTDGEFREAFYHNVLSRQEQERATPKE